MKVFTIIDPLDTNLDYLMINETASDLIIIQHSVIFRIKISPLKTKLKQKEYKMKAYP